jgi:hypothetical protein
MAPSNDTKDRLHTWWHDNGVIDTKSEVDKDKVRQSRKYRVQVRCAPPEGQAGGEFLDSFVYESIPRSGHPKSTDLPPEGDGISDFETDNEINMAWSQFQYNDDVEVKISSINEGQSLGQFARIRPTILGLKFEEYEKYLLVRIPRHAMGFRFSVEFYPDLLTYRSNGTKYVRPGEAGEVVGEEPKNALLIFASPFLATNVTPSMDNNNTLEMTPGEIDPHRVTRENKKILYFPPGIYWLKPPADADSKLGRCHLKLPEETYWVHFAPGAYVKAAIEYSTHRKFFYATGHGVLSGENYLYTANSAKKYIVNKSDGDSLRMWWHKNLMPGQTWICVGPTVNAPPFNSMDFGPERHPCAVKIWDYKQVGAFYMQTDGPQLYFGSEMHDVFLHVNDDAIKAYHSCVNVARATIWKCHNDPVIQMGWDSRNVFDFNVQDLWIIHTRYFQENKQVPSAIIGASPYYDASDKEPDKGPDMNKSISIRVKNVICEGPAPALLYITPLQNYDRLQIENVHYTDRLSPVTWRSFVGGLTKPNPDLNMSIRIKNWTIGRLPVTMNDFQYPKGAGKMDIDAQYWTKWSISPQD